MSKPDTDYPADTAPSRSESRGSGRRGGIPVAKAQVAAPVDLPRNRPMPRLQPLWPRRTKSEKLDLSDLNEIDFLVSNSRGRMLHE